MGNRCCGSRRNEEHPQAADQEGAPHHARKKLGRDDPELSSGTPVQPELSSPAEVAADHDEPRQSEMVRNTKHKVRRPDYRQRPVPPVSSRVVNVRNVHDRADVKVWIDNEVARMDTGDILLFDLRGIHRLTEVRIN